MGMGHGQWKHKGMCVVSGGTGMRVCCWYWYEGMFGGTSTRVHFGCIY